MKKIFLILFGVLTIPLFANKYYCSTTGNDNNSGTLESPWKSWRKAMRTTPSGDTCYFRGGTYDTTFIVSLAVGYGYSGTASNPTCFFNYPDEVPILDGSNIAVDGNFGIQITGMSYMYFKGLTIRNFWQQKTDGTCGGIKLLSCNGIRIENCVVHDIGSRGYFSYNSDSTFMINCDAYNCCDYLTSTDPGGSSVGFFYMNTTDDAYGYLYGCRAWYCTDGGFADYGGSHYVYDSCWAFLNTTLYGHEGDPAYTGDGNGFKPGFVTTDPDTAREFNYCLSVYNQGNGFRQNGDGPTYAKMNMYIYNCTTYKNGWAVGHYGFSNLDPELYTDNETIYRNNVAYQDYYGAFQAGTSGVTHDHNSWNGAVTVTDADFVSVDSTGISGARQADGSLPVLTFLNLASTSDLIDAGIDVGLTYYNDTADIGFFEYPEFPETAAPYINTNEPIITRSREVIAGGNMIYDGGGTISAKGVVYSQEINPTTADSIIVVGTGTDDFTVRVPNLTKSTTYHIRAYATNQTGTAYGADVEFTTPASSPVETGGKLLKHGNYYIKIE